MKLNLPVNNSLIAYPWLRCAKTSAIALDIINEKFTVKSFQKSLLQLNVNKSGSISRANASYF